ncbi:thioredoxin-like protein [Obelidium mucronatum]|nr:thioredoxin-like protein [Obelidium mucronatum]
MLDKVWWLLKQAGTVFIITTLLNVVLPRIIKFFFPPKIGTVVEQIAGLKFIKGEEFEVPNVKEKKVTVLEHWATWCGPCVKGIPHITEVAKKFPNVSFVGVTQETDEGLVQEFVNNMGTQMDYNVAIDSNGAIKKVVKDSGGMGIPHAIVINAAGKMVWAGHPMSSDFETAIANALKDE